jgi:RNA polymerase sigma-70 factor (ECF subfamily)
MSIEGPVKEEQGIIRGEIQPFEELFKVHHRRVYAVCLRMTGNAAEAEDLTQEVFLQMFRKLATFRGESTFSTWLHRLTVNHVLMHFRKRRSRRERLTEDSEVPERPVSPGVPGSSPVLDRIALNEAILKLSPGYRAVFFLHDVEGLQHGEIAEILGCSVGTSKSQLHKARMKLRGLLRQRTDATKTPWIELTLKAISSSETRLSSNPAYSQLITITSIPCGTEATDLWE